MWYGEDHWDFSAYRRRPRPANYPLRRYAYTPSPAQRAVAQRRVKEHLAAVRNGRRPAATHRYIAVETLQPTDSQRAAYLKAQAETGIEAPRVEPVQLRCVMVFDTVAGEFAGSGCYIVEGSPRNGSVAQFESVRAEFVSGETL